MKRHFLTLLIALLWTLTIRAQNNIGIGTSVPHPSAILELSANNKGFLMTRVALQSDVDVATIPAPV